MTNLNGEEMDSAKRSVIYKIEILFQYHNFEDLISIKVLTNFSCLASLLCRFSY
jgi:hypothetical protein